MLGPDGRMLEAFSMPYLLASSKRGIINKQVLRNALWKYSQYHEADTRRARFSELSSALATLSDDDIDEMIHLKSKLRELTEQILHAPLATCKVFIEVQQPMRGQGKRDGAAAAFKTGRLYGILEGIVAGLGAAYEDVRPKAWQAHFGLHSSEFSGVHRKRYHIIEAQKHFPGVEFDEKDGIADAALIAKYGMTRP